MATKSRSYRAPIPKGSREGYVSDLSPRDRRALKLRSARVQGRAAVRRSKTFLEEHGLLIAAGVAAVVLFTFRAELKAKIGAEPLQLPY